MNSKYTHLVNLLEQEIVETPKQMKQQFIPLSKLYTGYSIECPTKCKNSNDALCIDKCYVDASDKAIRQGNSYLTTISQIQDEKIKTPLQTRFTMEIKRMRDQNNNLRNKLTIKRSKLK